MNEPPVAPPQPEPEPKPEQGDSDIDSEEIPDPIEEDVHSNAGSRLPLLATRIPTLYVLWTW